MLFQTLKSSFWGKESAIKLMWEIECASKIENLPQSFNIVVDESHTSHAFSLIYAHMSMEYLQCKIISS